MDPRLIRYYNQELQHLREMGAEFAAQFPKIAGRLGMDGIEVSDPYVERLLEGAAFLAARVQLKLDAEFPRFTRRLLEIVHPSYLAPTPAMIIAQLRPELTEGNLATGFTIPRGSAMKSLLGKGESTACEFRTAHDVTLWPIEIASAEYFSFAPDLPLTSLPVSARIKGGLRLRLKATAGLKLREIRLDRLRLFLSGADDVAYRLYELLCGSTVGVAAAPPVRPWPWREFLPRTSVTRAGLADREALLPVSLRGFQGYRLLQEYFAFPHRFLFVDVAGLAPALRRCEGDELELVILFERGDAALGNVVDAGNFALNCAPAINLFDKRADRIHLDSGSYEFHVVPDRTRPMDFEVHEITGVTGYGAGAETTQTFRPFYAAGDTEDHTHNAFYTTWREPRLLSAAQKRNGFRSSYIGSEVFLSLVDANEAPFSGDLRQLAVTTRCTNRDLPLSMPVGSGGTDFNLDSAAPITGIRCIKGPSKPYSPLADAAQAWQIINQLSLNYLSLTDTNEREGAAALRELLELYAPTAEAGLRKQIEGVRRVAVRPIVRRLPMPGPVSFGRGLEIVVGVEELAFQGGSAFLFGAVLEQFFARHCSLNSFTETVLTSGERGEIMRWAARCGQRATL